jgi:exodeoxyribonuclease VII large subunit
VPVVSAVGHETGYDDADFVADRRAPTPSAAADDRAGPRRNCGIAPASPLRLLESMLRERLASGQRYDTSACAHGAPSAGPDVNRERQRVDEMARHAQAAAERAHRDAVQGVGGCVWRLKALDPFATLERGYSIVQRGAAVISSVGSVRTGEALDVRVKDGTFGAVVAGRAPTRKRLKRRIADAQAPLFTMPEERA